MFKKLKVKFQKFIPKDLIDGKCPNCGATVPKGEPFWCCFCKQSLNYHK